MCNGKTFECKYKGHVFTVTVSMKTFPERAKFTQTSLSGGFMDIRAGVDSGAFRLPTAVNLYIGDTAAFGRQQPTSGVPTELPRLQDAMLCEFSLSAKITSSASDAAPIEIGFVQFVTKSNRIANYKPPDGFADFRIGRDGVVHGTGILDCGLGTRPWFQGKFGRLDKATTECQVRAFDNPKWEIPTQLDLANENSGPCGPLNSVLCENAFSTFVVVSCKAQGGIKFVPLLQTQWSSSMKVDEVHLQGTGTATRIMSNTFVDAKISCDDWSMLVAGPEWEFGDKHEIANDKLTDFATYRRTAPKLDLDAEFEELDNLLQ